jgi:hypothetical protein
MQEGGKIIPPPASVAGPGWSWPSPLFWVGSGPEEDDSIWAEIGPAPFGLSPAQLVGPDQPNPFNIIYYIYYILYYLYIYI